MVSLERVALPDAVTCLSHRVRDLISHGLPTDPTQAAHQAPGYDGATLSQEVDEEIGRVPNAGQSHLRLHRTLLEEARLRPHQSRRRRKQPQPIPIDQVEVVVARWPDYAEDFGVEAGTR